MRLVAQGPPNEFVFHVYVDPIFGDDDRAWAQNPGNPLPDPGNNNAPMLPGPGPPLDTRAAIAPAGDPVHVAGYLQHAPYSFRTISGAKGAKWYVNTLFTVPIYDPIHLPNLAAR